MGMIVVIHGFSLELLICGMHSNPKVNEQNKVRDLASILGFYCLCVCLCSASEDLNWIVSVIV